MRTLIGIRVAMITALTTCALVAAKFHATYVGSYDLSSTSRLSWTFVLILLSATAAYAFGLPDRPSFNGIGWASIFSAVMPPMGIALIQTVLGEILLPRFLLLAMIPASFAVYLLAGVSYRSFCLSTIGQEKTVLLCDTQEADIVQRDITVHTELPVTVIATVDPTRVTPDALVDRISNLDRTSIVIGSSVVLDQLWLGALAKVHARGVSIRNLGDFYDLYLGKLPLQDIELESLFFDVREVHRTSYARITRAVDIIVGLFGMFFLFAALPFVIVGNLFGNRGPLFYSQDRIGKGMDSFRIHKFRSMAPNGSGTQWTAHDDPRITKFGRFLRTSHMDELPQVLNILRGDLSIVGPRPEQPHYVEELTRELPSYAARHLVRPGLTGWAQVNYPYGADNFAAFEKLQFDLWYLRHQSVVLDAVVIARTLRHVLGFKGR